MGFSWFDSSYCPKADKTVLSLIMSTFKTVDVNGQQANLLVADLNDGQKLSVITNSLLQRLVKLLPKASPRSIIQDFAEELMKYADDGECDIEGFVSALQNELDFHKSVNLINEFFINERKPDPIVAH